ncbi:hypothetical protein ACEPPN_004891 [Leptodophora sp. 'Broadleaf-Isolate-01']
MPPSADPQSSAPFLFSPGSQHQRTTLRNQPERREKRSVTSTELLFHINYGCLDCDEAVQNIKLKEKMPTTLAPADDTMKFSALPGLTITTFDEYNAKVRAKKAEKDEVARSPLAARSHKIKSKDEDEIQMLDEESKMEAS